MKRMRTFTLVTIATVFVGVCLLVPVTSEASAATFGVCAVPVAVGDFDRGYREGYRVAYPIGRSPLPPVPPVGKNTYQHGYGMGYAQGLMDKANAGR
jgi:hypothetical protein